MKTQPNSSLADKIAGILSTAPSNFDPEDDSVDTTNAQVLPKYAEDSHEDEQILSKFRRENVDLLADLDEKYAGKKTSRKNLKGSDSDTESEATEVEDDNIDRDEDDDIDNMQEDLESNSVSSNSLEESSDDKSIEDSSEGSEDENEDAEDNTNFKHLKDTNVSNQIQKGMCVRNQMAMWEKLLEIRIQLQKCVSIANKLPEKNTFDHIKQESGSEFPNKVNETKNTVCATLDKMLLLQKLLLKQYPETRNLKQQQNVQVDDEEIPSDTENEQSASEEENEPETKKGKKRKFEEYEEELTDFHKRYKDYRNGVIQKWNDKTQVVVKGGNSSRSVLDQIEYTLSNKEKLIKRTQVKRTQYAILGEEANDDKVELEHTPEIFDDDDFYHQLLRELIEVKSADVTDPVQLGQQWIQLQNLRSKMKRKIDTRATKGRKIRYAVHNQLVNFMASIDENSWTDEAKNELYNSLFGKSRPPCNV